MKANDSPGQDADPSNKVLFNINYTLILHHSRRNHFLLGGYIFKRAPICGILLFFWGNFFTKGTGDLQFEKGTTSFGGVLQHPRFRHPCEFNWPTYLQYKTDLLSNKDCQLQLIICRNKLNYRIL